MTATPHSVPHRALDGGLTGGRHGCPVCPQRFDSVGAKKRHIRLTHPTRKD